MMKRPKVPVIAKLVLTTFVFSFEATVLAQIFVEDIVSEVSQSSYTNYLDNMLYTHTGDDRGFGAEHDLARDNIFAEFNSFGLDTSYAPFPYSDETYYNVVGVHQGITRPEDIYVLGAHYDSVNNPGADDNASGTSGVLEAARVLSQFDFEASLVFIAFDREEQGLFGSKAYAQEHTDDNILGMLSLDMIAYDGSGSDHARIYGRDSSLPFQQSVAEAISLFGNGLSSGFYGQLDASDHAPFEAEGFQACLLIEGDLGSNPYYHQQTDTVDSIDYIDYDYAANMVSSAVGLFASLAEPVPEPTTVLLLGLGGLVLRRRKNI